MSVMDEVAQIKKDIDELKIKKARLQERLDAGNHEKERLLTEAKRLGVKDTSKLKEYVAKRKESFDLAKEKILKWIEEADQA